MELGARIEAVRSFSDGGMSSECNAQIKKNKVGSAFVIQIADRIEERIHKMKWKTNFRGGENSLERRDSHTSRMHSCS